MKDYTRSSSPEFILKNAPRAYPATEQQMRMRDVARKCGIHKGMKKADLMRLMKECVGPAMRKENHG